MKLYTQRTGRPAADPERMVRLMLLSCLFNVFAESKIAHGLDRARSRGLDCMQEQALLTAIVQNLKRLCRFQKKRPQTDVSACRKPEPVMTEAVSGLLISALVGWFAFFYLPIRRLQPT